MRRAAKVRIVARIVVRIVALIVAVLAAGALGGPAAADVTLGVFTPAAHFANSQARLELAQKLATYLGDEVLAQKVRSRVYARAEDFERAVREKTLQLALVDAVYLVRSKSEFRVLAAGPEVEWKLIAAAAIPSVASLRGKRLRLAAGGNERWVAQGLFDGEAEAFFAPGADGIAATQDSASALAAVALGKADAALVPARLPLGDGLVVLETFEKMPGVLLVAYGESIAASFAGALKWSGDEPVASLEKAGQEQLPKLRSRLEVKPRHAPMPALTLRVLINSLASPPLLAIPQRPAQDFAQRSSGAPVKAR